MEEDIGFDVSMKETAVSIRRDGKRIWRGKCASDPKVLADLVACGRRKQSGSYSRRGRCRYGSSMPCRQKVHLRICIDARHAKAALGMALNKTDVNDADGLAHLAEVGFFEVDYDGHISRRGNGHHDENRSRSGLRTWGIKLREKIRFKCAAVAVARKLAVIMHAMLVSGEFFERRAVTI